MTRGRWSRRGLIVLCGGLSPLALSEAEAPIRRGAAGETANGVGDMSYPQNAAESAHGVRPVASQFIWGDLRRYGGDPTGLADSSAAWSDAVRCGYVEIPPRCNFRISIGAKHSGPVTILGYGPTSVVSCDGPILTLTEASGSLLSNFGMDAINTPLVFRRHAETTVRTTCTARAGASAISVASAEGIVVGMRAMGPSVWQGATVIAVSGTAVSLSRPNTSSANASPVSFYHITFNTGLDAYRTLTRTKEDGYRIPTLNDQDIWFRMSAQEKAQTQVGPVLSLAGDHITVEKLTGRFISVLFNGCSWSTMRDCDFKGGWTWGCCAFLNFTPNRTCNNSAFNNRFREHGFEGILFMGCDGWTADGNVCFANGDSGIETYQSAPSQRTNSTYFDGCSGGKSSNNTLIANYQGAINYEGNFGSALGSNSGVSSSVNDYCAWHPNGAAAFTGSGWTISNLNCEYNPGAAVYANISDSIFSGTFRENNFAPVGGFNAIAVIGTNNLINGVRAQQETSRSPAYTLQINAGKTGNCVLTNVDLRDAVTKPNACLTLAGNVQKFNVRTNGKYDQNIYAVQAVQPAVGPNVAIDLAEGTSFMILVDADTSFVIADPLSASAGQRFTIQIWNQTAAAIPAPRWGKGYRLAPWTSPGAHSHRCIEFECNGNGDLCYEIGRTTEDIPN